jgi:hypothetical protein
VPEVISGININLAMVEDGQASHRAQAVQGSNRAELRCLQGVLEDICFCAIVPAQRGANLEAWWRLIPQAEYLHL